MRRMVAGRAPLTFAFLPNWYLCGFLNHGTTRKSEFPVALAALRDGRDLVQSLLVFAVCEVGALG